MRKEQIRDRALAHLARLPKNSGHARVLRAKLGITSSASAPAPVVEEPVVEEPVVVEDPVAEAVEEAPKPKRKRAPRKKKSEQ